MIKGALILGAGFTLGYGAAMVQSTEWKNTLRAAEDMLNCMREEKDKNTDKVVDGIVISDSPIEYKDMSKHE